MPQKPKSAVFTPEGWELYKTAKKREQTKVRKLPKYEVRYEERPDAINETMRVYHQLPENVSVNSKVAETIMKDKESTSLSNPKNAYLDYKVNQKHYDRQLEEYVETQKQAEKYRKDSKEAQEIMSDPNWVVRSGAPMDNTIIHFDTPLFGKTSTEVLTPQQRFNALGTKLEPSVIDYTLMGATALPLIYLLGAPIASSIVTNPVSWAASAAGGWLGTEGVNSGIRLLTDYNSWGDMMADTKLGKYVINKLGPDVGKPVLEFTNVGGIGGGIKGWNVGQGIEKRGAEVFMRSTSMGNPLIDIKRKALNTPAEQYAAITKYVLFNQKNKKVPYKFLGKPDEQYTGILSDDQLEGDVIDAFLYGKDMHPDIGIKVATGEDFGPHEAYIREAYPTKASKIPVYELSVLPVDRRVIDGTTSRYGLIKDTDQVVPAGQVYGSENAIALKDGRLYDSGGHYVQYGNSSNGTHVLRHQDIWKFNPKEYYNKWLSGSERPYWEKLLLKYGLNFVDSHGTPVIARTPWLLYDTNTYQ